MDDNERSIQEQSLKLQRQKEILGFAKFFLGSVVVYLTVTIVNSGIQRQQLDQERQRSEIEFISEFAQHALTKDLEQRRDLAEYFSKVSPTESARELWIEYHGVTVERISRARATEQDIVRIQQEITDSKTRLASSTSEIRRLRDALRDAERRLTVGGNAGSEVEALRALVAETEKQKMELEKRESETAAQLAAARKGLVETQRELADIRTAVAVTPPPAAPVVARPPAKQNPVAGVPAFDPGDAGRVDQVSQELLLRAGSWFANLESVSDEPAVFRGYFLKVRESPEESMGAFAVGDIVTGDEWDGSDVPRFRGAKGGDGDIALWDHSKDYAFLGLKWRDEYEALARVFTAR